MALPSPQTTSLGPTATVDQETTPSAAELTSGQHLQDASSTKDVLTGPATTQSVTTHGKPRERVVLACVQCRNRKVRCDGTKPECFNCVKRADPAAGPCSYDAAPRRRGKDRTPGSRRLAPFEAKKTRTTRSRVEEDAKRRKAEEKAAAAAAKAEAEAAAQAAQVAAAAAFHAPNFPHDQDPSSSRSVHALPVTVIPSQERPTPTHSGIHSSALHSSLLSPASSCTTPSDAATALPVVRNIDPGDLRPPDHAHVSAYAASSSYYTNEDEEEYRPHRIPTPPGVQFTRETWWDALLSFYADTDPALHTQHGMLTADVRGAATAQIVTDLRFLFHVSLHWFAFLHVPRFFAELFDPHRRQCVQPSLVLGALALATFFQSSELERGARGRERALRLLDQAHALFDASLSSGWIDVGLAQTAWLFAMFEIQAHPRSSATRSRSAFLMLDALMRSLSLTVLDIDDPRTSTFVPGAVPVVPPSAASLLLSPPERASHSFDLLADPGSLQPGAGGGAYAAVPHTPPSGSGYGYGYGPGYGSHDPLAPASYPDRQPSIAYPYDCGCQAYSLGHNWPLAQDLTPAWTNMPMWPEGAGEGAMQKEQCRRLVWSTVMLTVTHSTKTTAGTDREPQHLWIKDPANYALLFPGESFAAADTPTAHIALSKDSVWALYMRTLFLWHSCLRARVDADVDRAQWAMAAWLELDAVEAAMDRHTCDIQSGFMLQMREVLFNTRMVVSNEFRMYIPEALTASGQLFYHEKAEWWMSHMLQLAKSFRDGQLRAAKGFPGENVRRCFLMYWFMSHIMRCLALWYADRSLMIALEVAKAFAPCVEFMMMIWPSPSQRRQYEGLRGWLVRTCQIAGVAPPVRAVPVPPRKAPQQQPSAHESSAHTPAPGAHAGAAAESQSQQGEIVTEPVPKAPPPLPMPMPALTRSPTVQPHPPPHAHAHLQPHLLARSRSPSGPPQVQVQSPMYPHPHPGPSLYPTQPSFLHSESQLEATPSYPLSPSHGPTPYDTDTGTHPHPHQLQIQIQQPYAPAHPSSYLTVTPPSVIPPGRTSLDGTHSYPYPQPQPLPAYEPPAPLDLHVPIYADRLPHHDEYAHEHPGPEPDLYAYPQQPVHPRPLADPHGHPYSHSHT